MSIQSNKDVTSSTGNLDKNLLIPRQNLRRSSYQGEGVKYNKDEISKSNEKTRTTPRKAPLQKVGYCNIYYIL